jgi:hypothetical protein
LNCRKVKLQYAQCEEISKIRNRGEKGKRAECAHIKEHEKDKERIDIKRQKVKPSMNRVEE